MGATKRAIAIIALTVGPVVVTHLSGWLLVRRSIAETILLSPTLAFVGALALVTLSIRAWLLLETLGVAVRPMTDVGASGLPGFADDRPSAAEARKYPEKEHAAHNQKRERSLPMGYVAAGPRNVSDWFLLAILALAVVAAGLALVYVLAIARLVVIWVAKNNFSASAAFVVGLMAFALRPAVLRRQC
jgi:hypothetical protein